jgi:hypothetical protein
MAILCGIVWGGSQLRVRGEARDSTKAHTVAIPVTIDDVSAPQGPCCSVSMVPKMAGAGTQCGV